MTVNWSTSLAKSWLVSPAFDLLFIANLGWLLLFLPAWTTANDTVIDFWLIYFITLPHRWITLILVATDADRRDGQSRKLMLVAVLAAVVVLAAYLGTGAFLCLAMIDFIWNAWHFASQHAGVLRLYSKKVGGGFSGLDRWGLRLFITYTALRAASWTTGWMPETDSWQQTVSSLDFAMLLLPIIIMANHMTEWNLAQLPKWCYLGSVCCLYMGFLWSLHSHWSYGVLLFAAAASMFHAVEYLGIVTYYAKRRREIGSGNLFRRIAHYWTPFLILYIVLLGSIGTWAEQLEPSILVFWQGLNLWAAFVHYAFDGMIWKLRRPETAQALGATPV